MEMSPLKISRNFYYVLAAFGIVIACVGMAGASHAIQPDNNSTHIKDPAHFRGNLTEALPGKVAFIHRIPRDGKPDRKCNIQK